MDNKDLKKKLRKLKPILEKNYKVKSIGLFGSFARNEANEDSDIDILVEFSENIGWEFIDLKKFLEENLDREVDLVTIEALKPELKEDILRDVIYLLLSSEKCTTLPIELCNTCLLYTSPSPRD